MKNIKFFILISLFLISCGNNNHQWSSETKKDFLDACVQEAITDSDESSAYSYCDCVLNEFMKIYDEESFAKEELKMVMGLPTSEKFSDDFANIVFKCSSKLNNY